ncbi:MAG: ATP-binding protein, partial [Actinomycetota bacterium]
ASIGADGDDRVSDITISVPAHPEYLHVLRSVMASVAASFDFSLERIDDLRMAVDEACAQLLAVSSSENMLTVRAKRLSDGLDVAASTDAHGVAWPPRGIESTFAWKILSTLVGEIDFRQSTEGAIVRFTMRSPISPAKI